MTQKEIEDRELLLKDLCARLPYGVILECCELVGEELRTITKEGLINDDYDIDEVKPMLLPLSSMTEAQKNQLKEIWDVDMEKAIDYSISGKDELCDLCQLSAAGKVINWLNKHHFDWRGLIPLGLANDATGLNIY